MDTFQSNVFVSQKLIVDSVGFSKLSERPFAREETLQIILNRFFRLQNSSQRYCSWQGC